MARFINDRTASKGTAPGSLIFMGKRKMDESILNLMDYNSEDLEEVTLNSIEEFEAYIDKDSVSWLNIYGLHDLELVRKVGEMVKLNPLLMEDMLDTNQMPKYESTTDYDAFVLKMLTLDNKTGKLNSEQFTLILGENFVITIQEQPGDVFNPVRERIRNKGRIRLNSNDYLAYALLDTIADNYIILIEELGRKIEDLESHILDSTNRDIVKYIYHHKIELNYLRKQIRPLRDVMNQVLKSENTFFQPENRNFLLDLNDLINQSTDAIELYTRLVSDQLNIFSTNVNSKMNEIMKTLTVFASIFIPLTFLAGVYGMNFEYFPELEFKYSYPVFWIVSLSITGYLLYYFKKKRWW